MSDMQFVHVKCRLFGDYVHVSVKQIVIGFRIINTKYNVATFSVCSPRNRKVPVCCSKVRCSSDEVTVHP